MVAWRRTDFRTCADLGAALVLATAPRETFERAGTGRKTGTSSREAIRRGHFFSRWGLRPLRGPTPLHATPGGAWKVTCGGTAGMNPAYSSTLHSFCARWGTSS